MDKFKTFCEGENGREGDITHTGLYCVRDDMCVYNFRQNK